LSRTANILVSVCLAFALACSRAENATAPAPLPVAVAEVREAKIPIYVEHVGTTESVHTVEVRARVRGVLEKVFFKEGADVEQGALLFLIEQAPYQAALARAKGDLARALATAERARADFARTSELARKQVASQADLDHARATRDEAEAAVASLRAAVQQAELDISYTEVHAPIAGRIGRVHVDDGNLVGGNEETVITTIVQLDPIRMSWSPSEKERLDVLRLRREGRYVQREEIEVRAMLADGSEHPHPGKLDFVDNTVDPTVGTVRVRAVFPNPDKTLLPGQFARLRILIGRDVPALLVPAQAILEEQGGSTVWVVGNDGTVSARAVVPGITSDDSMRVVESGLVAGDKVVVDNLGKLRPGMKVAVRDGAAESGDAAEGGDVP
jgi:membrane fusion protein (multidrug efflux system)